MYGLWTSHGNSRSSKAWAPVEGATVADAYRYHRDTLRKLAALRCCFPLFLPSSAKDQMQQWHTARRFRDRILSGLKRSRFSTLHTIIPAFLSPPSCPQTLAIVDTRSTRDLCHRVPWPLAVRLRQGNRRALLRGRRLQLRRKHIHRRVSVVERCHHKH